MGLNSESVKGRVRIFSAYLYLGVFGLLEVYYRLVYPSLLTLLVDAISLRTMFQCFSVTKVSPCLFKEFLSD